MRDDMRAPRSAAIIFLVTMGWVTTATAAPITLSFATQTVNQGSTFDVALFLNDVVPPVPPTGEVIDLVGYSLYLAYDPTKVDFVDDKDDGVIQPVFSSLQTISIPPIDPITAVAIAASLAGQGPGLTGSSLLLATISFTAKGVGDAGIAFFVGDPSFGFNPAFFTSGTDCLSPESTPVDCVLRFEPAPGTITIESTTPVPEPSTMGLLGLGLLAVARRLRVKPRSPTSAEPA